MSLHALAKDSHFSHGTTLSSPDTLSAHGDIPSPNSSHDIFTGTISTNEWPMSTGEKNSADVPLARLHHYFEASCDAKPHSPAVIAETYHMTYAELDRRANQLARLLRANGIDQRSRVGILLERSEFTYISLLGALKAGASFVPLDPSSPAERVEYITTDSSVDVLLTSRSLVAKTETVRGAVWALDELHEMLERESPHRLHFHDQGDPVAYVCYTSGSSGRPKGVEVAQSSICNLIHVVSRLYNVRSTDRVYQGMTIAFDFSFEEIWPTWAVGATLIPGPNDGRRVGAELADFLDRFDVTVLYCVPTVLATLDRDLPRIHTLNVGGEACSDELIRRWSRPGRLMLNTYGPTEITVTCMYARLEPSRPVTIGYALPTYEAYLLDENLRPVPAGDVGEICIGGPGVALGYLGRPDLTAEKFVPHPFGGQGRIYRTGDLGRITEWGVEYLGRADSQVKVRGHRVDLGEIESLIRAERTISDAVVIQDKDSGQLAAYVTVKGSPEPESFMRIHASLSANVPGYMVPAFLTVLDMMPMLPSAKVDRKALPAPTTTWLAPATGPQEEPHNDLEREVQAMWAAALKVPAGAVSVTADFFTELGGHSLAAATAVTAIRTAYPEARIGVADLYTYPTVRGFANRLSVQQQRSQQQSAPRIPVNRHSDARVTNAGACQAGMIYTLLLILSLPIAVIYGRAGGQISNALMQELLIWVPTTYFLARWILPVVGIRLLSLGIVPGRYPLWGRVHLRVWGIERLLDMSPLSILCGSPLAAPYLRLLGAHVGRHCHIGSAEMQLPSLIRLEDGASVGYGSQVQPVSVQQGWMTLAPIVLGRHAFVGSSAFVSGGSYLHERAMLLEHSALAPDTTCEPGQVWGGSPARAGHPMSPLVYAIAQHSPRIPALRNPGLWLAFLIGLLTLELIPVLAIAPVVAIVWGALLTFGQTAGLIATVLSGPLYVLSACITIAVARFIVVGSTPQGIFPAVSWTGYKRWYLDKLLELSLFLTNSLYATLYTTSWLRLLGAKIGRGSEVSTVSHVDPQHLVIGPESFVADMAHIGSAVHHHGYVATAKTEVGTRAFVGNACFIPAGTALGAGSLVGVHTVPPQDGVPENSSWLGSPAIFLPQRQESQQFDDSLTFNPSRSKIAERLGIEFLRATMPAAILGCMVYVALNAVSFLAHNFQLWFVVICTPLVFLACALGTVLIAAGVKWCVIGDYNPRVEPLWSRYVRLSELATGVYEAAAVPALLSLLVGTPFMGPALRLFGARIGRRAYIGTTFLTEFDMVDVGNDVTIGKGASLQTHLFEDRVMKISVVKIADGASVGDRSVVLYDTVVTEGAVLGPLSLVMKGESLPPNTHWQGIPAEPCT